MRIIGFALLLALSASQAGAKETKTEIGRLTGMGGSFSFSVTSNDERKSASIFVYDKHVIKTNLIFMSKDQLLKLRSLIDETITELEKSEAPQSSSSEI